MSDTDVAAILKLPLEERLRLVEWLWESLSATPEAVPLGDAHRAAVDDEFAAHRRAPDDVVSLEEVLSEVRKTR